MEKSIVLKKVRELAYAQLAFDRDITINSTERAVIMETFGISWLELEKPSDTFSLYYEMKKSESDLKKELDWYLKMLKLQKEKGLYMYERETKHMLTGFLKGIRFFNKELSDKFSLEADNALSAA